MVSIAREVTLKPLGKKTLNYLRNSGTLTPLVAFSLWGTMRLSAQIHDLREAGYEIDTEIRVDEEGQRYSAYTLRDKLAS